MKVEKNPQEVGDEKAGDDGDEDHGHLVLSLPPPVLDLLSLVRLALTRRGGRSLVLPRFVVVRSSSPLWFIAAANSTISFLGCRYVLSGYK